MNSDNESTAYETAGYDYGHLYGLLSIPFIGLLVSFLTYLFKKYYCHALLRFINFVQNAEGNDDQNDSYGSPVLQLHLLFFIVMISMTTTLHRHQHMPVLDIQTKFVYLFIWGFTSLSTLYRSYHDG